MTNQGKTSKKIPKQIRFTLGDSITSNRKLYKKSISQKSRQNRQSNKPNECDETHLEKLALQDDHDDAQEPVLFSKRSSVSSLEEAGSTENIPTLDDTDTLKVQPGEDTQLSNSDGKAKVLENKEGLDVLQRDENNIQRTAYASGAAEVEKTERNVKHIHPCICDLSAKQRHRIKTHVEKVKRFENRLIKRLEEIDLERIALEEELRRKEEEEREQQELFGDEYEVIGKKKKRLKRSARRASMVSLGVKQVINWRRSPKIKVKYNKVSDLRRSHSSYCGERPYNESSMKKIGFENSPKIPVRITKTTALRAESNLKRREDLLKREDKKPRFIVAPPV